MNQKKISSKDNYVSDSDLCETDIVILCGGLGKRLRPVISEQPKVLAKIGNLTFLDILINNISSYGTKNIILCVGYLKDRIKERFDCCRANHCDNYNYRYGEHNIIFSEEESPLGTGGAIKNAKQLIKSDPFIVMNGDSICNIDFNGFLDFHTRKEAILSMILAKSTTTEDYGHVTLDKSQRITSFNEKMSNNDKYITNTDLNKNGLTTESLINAGIYLMQKEIFSYMPEQDNFSLENDLFPKIVNDKATKSRCYGLITNGKLLDIGTPERYKIAVDTLS